MAKAMPVTPGKALPESSGRRVNCSRSEPDFQETIQPVLKTIVGVKFKKEGKIYNFDAGDLAILVNDPVIVSTDDGTSMGTVLTSPRSVPEEDIQTPLKPVIRKVTEEDLRIRDSNRTLEESCFSFCSERIKIRNLPMKLIDVECLFDRSKIIFYFTAENRVDFREIVKDLAQKYKTKIELRQIGARQEARIVKGMGVCGREVCCVNLLHNLDRVSVKMAKEQNMSLNPEKISGLCGRLMCCLAFEYECYRERKKDKGAQSRKENAGSADHPSSEKPPQKPGRGDHRNDPRSH
jgi:cell fate regulator YaaT (PSP1 superfamily)